mgnify:CR=1 FL=1
MDGSSRTMSFGWLDKGASHGEHLLLTAGESTGGLVHTLL